MIYIEPKHVKTGLYSLGSNSVLGSKTETEDFIRHTGLTYPTPELQGLIEWKRT